MSNPAPGWYQAAGDPPNSVRYWDGSAWHHEVHQIAPAPQVVQPQPQPQVAHVQPTPPVGVDPAGVAAATNAQPVVQPHQSAEAAVVGEDPRAAWDPELLAEQAEAKAQEARTQSTDVYEPSAGWLPDIGRQLAELGPRLGARVFDVLVLLVLKAVLGIGGDSYLLASLVPALVFYLYEVGLTMAQGATLGKRALGMTAVGSAGETPPSPRAAALRSLPALLTVIPGVFGLGVWALLMVGSLVLAFGDPERRSVGDRLGATLVVTSS